MNINLKFIKKKKKKTVNINEFFFGFKTKTYEFVVENAVFPIFYDKIVETQLILNKSILSKILL